MRTRMLIAVAVCLVGGVLADPPKNRFTVKPGEFDPAHTHLVQAAWLAGIGCPTAAKILTFNDQGAVVGGTFTDPACPAGDNDERKDDRNRDKNVEGLLLAKTGPTANVASAFARIDGVNGQVITELGWDIRKPGPDLSVGPRGSHCGAGAPRWNIETRDGKLFFLGCNSPPAPVQIPGIGFVRMRWGGAVPLLAFDASTGALTDITGAKVKSLAIVFDEGQDTGGPDNFGMAILDNIDVNGILVGKGPTDADAE